VQALLQGEWVDTLRREGTLDEDALARMTADGDDGEPTCPACGHQGALAAGACADCGLQLE
jgi:hypothetical protein